MAVCTHPARCAGKAPGYDDSYVRRTRQGKELAKFLTNGRWIGKLFGLEVSAMKMSRSIWFFSFATVAMAGFAWVVADAQTLGKRKLPGSITNSNISNLPISYTKVPFTLSMCKMPEKISGDDKNVVYFAPVIDTGPEFPAKPTFKFRVYGMRSAEWKESPGNPMLFENSGAKLEFTWWEGPRLLRMRLTNTQKQIDERRWEGTAGPMFDTLAIDVNMHDNVGKHWYYTRLVEFVESSGTIRIPLPGTQ